MAKFEKKKVVKENLDFMTIHDFIKKYHPGLTVPSINYAIDKDKLDYMQPGRERFIILTAKSLKYQPIDHPNRTTMSLED